MKLYKVTANKCDYDEYDSFVLWANTPEEALFLAQVEADKDYEDKIGGNFADDANIKEIIEPKDPCILLSSFNAG